MTVYVDGAFIQATVGRTRSRWCHLTADTQEELHAFAARVGMRREWFQTCKRRCGAENEPCIHWHYDLTAPRRARAVSLGAVEIDMHVMGEILRARRAALREGHCCPPEFRCICDPNDPFEPPDPTPRVVPGCPAHGARAAYQRWVTENAGRAAESTKDGTAGCTAICDREPEGEHARDCPNREA